MNNRHINRFQLVVLLFILFTFGIGVFAQNQIDQTFNAVPSVGPSPNGQVEQSDGKVIVWGTSLTVDGAAKDQLARLNVDGSLDTTYNYCSCYIPILSNVVIQPDNKVLVAGRGLENGAKVVRINTDGSLDTTFNTGFSTVPNPFFGGGSGQVLAIQPDGKVLVQTTYSFTGTIARAILRVNSDGSQDTSFTAIDLGSGRTFGSYVNATSILPDGKIVLAIYSYASISSSSSLKRFNSNGSADSSWEEPAFTVAGGQNSTTLNDIDRQSDGSIVVGGHFDSVNALTKFNFVRLLPGGNVDMTFNSSGFISGDEVHVLPSGKVLVGAATNISGAHKIYRLNSDGSTDGTFVTDPAVAEIITSWSPDASGKIVFFGEAASGPDRFFRLNANGDLDAGFNPNVGLMGTVNSAALQADGKIITAGVFLQMNGTPRSDVARLNSTGSLDTSLDPGLGFTAPPKSLLMQPDGKFIAVGIFNNYNGTARPGIARINPDGSLDATFNPTFNSNPETVALQSDGKIIVGGEFATVNGVNRPGIARLNADGTLDASFAPVIGNPFIGTVIVQPDGKILFGGFFSGVNGFSRSNLARLNADGSLDQTFNAGSIGTQPDFWLQPDGKIITSGLARRNTDGSVDASFTQPSLQSSDSVIINSVLIQADGSIIIGGQFDHVNGKLRNNIVRLSSSGVVDLFFFQNGANGQVRNLLGLPGGKILVTGDFTRFENSLRAGIVKVATVPFHKAAPFDFDGDGRTDISVTRNGSVYTWYQLRGSDHTFYQVNFGQTGDIVTPADFDGDGTTDIAIFRPSNGQWWYLSSIDGTQKSATSGAAGDIPMPADFTGDGKADFVVYRPSTGQWWRLENGGTTTSNIFFGSPGDKPVMGDFDGDGKGDVAIFRPSTGVFWYAASSQGNAFRAFQWGVATDVPATADYDGDGKTDFAIYRPSNGVWWIYNSSTGTTSNATWGAAEDKPVPADYDGDGRADTAVYRPSNGTWYLLSSTAGFSGFQWGISTDVPSPGAFVP